MTIQSDGYEVYEAYEGAPGKRLLGCWAHDIDVRTWLVDILKKIPTEKDINQLLPGNWKVLPANSRL